MTPRRRCAGLLGLIAFVAITVAPAMATQHLVRPGTDWSLLAARLQPGDEILLMPGEHMPAHLHGLAGTAEQPIVIRGLDPENPPTIRGGSFGLRLGKPAHVRIEHLIVRGASIHGIAIDGVAAPPPAFRGTEPEATGGIVLNAVQVLETGPRGPRHAILLRRIDDVRATGCRIEAWAGSAIEIVGCRDVRIEGLEARGRSGFEQESGVRIHGGSRSVLISGARIHDAGLQAICVGGATTDRDRAVPIDPEAEAGSAWEAESVRVERSLLVGGLCSIALLHARSVVLEHLTLLDPAEALLSLRPGQRDDPRFGLVERVRFDGGLASWKPGTIRWLLHCPPGTPLSGIELGENLWWCPGFAGPDSGLGPWPGTVALPQVTGLDPRLDAEGLPQAPEARIFGHTGT